MEKIDARVPHDCMDKTFRYIGDKWIEALHKNLKLPGEVVKLLRSDFAKDPKKRFEDGHTFTCKN